MSVDKLWVLRWTSLSKLALRYVYVGLYVCFFVYLRAKVCVCQVLGVVCMCVSLSTLEVRDVYVECLVSFVCVFLCVPWR